MPQDLRSFLARISNQLLKISREVNPKTQIGTLCSQSERPILFEKIRGYPGWRICDRIISNRKLQAITLNTTPEKVVSELARRITQGPGRKRIVKDGPVKEIILKGTQADLLKLPICKHSEGDGGLYIGGGIHVTRDPDTGVQNEAMLRTQIKGKRHAAFLMGRRHNWAHYEKYEKMGKPMPMAVVIGVHPAYEIAVNYSGHHDGYDEFELGAGLLGETLELVKCETADLHVPANAEIVIEGEVPPKVREKEGPFGEFQLYMGRGGLHPVWNIKAITMRKDAIYRHLNATAFTDHQALGTLPNEAEIFNNVKKVYGNTEVHDVYCPPVARFTAIVQMTPRYEGHAKAVLMAALAFNIHQKEVIVVDEDVDIYDLKAVFWAISTRVNPARDVIVIPGTRGHFLDPSTLEYSEKENPEPFNGMLGIDATRPSPLKPNERAKFDKARPMGEGTVFLRDFI